MRPTDGSVRAIARAKVSVASKPVARHVGQVVIRQLGSLVVSGAIDAALGSRNRVLYLCQICAEPVAEKLRTVLREVEVVCKQI